MCQPLPGRVVDDVPPVPAPLLPLQLAAAPSPGLPPAPPAPAAGRNDSLLLPADDADPAVAAGDVGRGHGELPGDLLAAPRHVDVAGQAEPQCGAV